MNNIITEKDSKAEIISHSCEIIDDLQLQNKTLVTQQKFLFLVSGVLLLINII